MPHLSSSRRPALRRWIIACALSLAAVLTAAPSASALEFSTISAGRAHTCATLKGSGGQTYCWGSNRQSQIGRLLISVARTPTYVIGTYDVTNLATGADYTCGARLSGEYSCWGMNLRNQLGIAGRSSAAYPDEQDAIPSPVSMAAGDYTTCAIDASQATWCWGSNFRRQVGVDPISFKGIPNPTRVPGIGAATQVTVGSLHACALLVGGQVSCWGDSGLGKLGRAIPNAIAAPGLTVAGIDDATQIAAGSQHTCAVRSGGTVWCWGSDLFGQLGTGDADQTSATPAQVPGLSGVTSLSARADTTCAVTGGRVFCWGAGDAGQLGNGSTSDAGTPVPVDYLGGIAQVAVGTTHACALNAAGTAYCWGQNSFGELGNGDLPGPEAIESSPVPVVRYVLSEANYLPASEIMRPLGSRGGSIELRTLQVRLRSGRLNCPSRARMSITADGKTRTVRVGDIDRNGDLCEVSGSYALAEGTSVAATARIRISGSDMVTKTLTLRPIAG